MALSKVPTYVQGSAGRGSVYVPPKLQPPKPVTLPSIGYTGSGWNYGGQTYKIPTSQSVTGAINAVPTTVNPAPSTAPIASNQPVVNAGLTQNPNIYTGELEANPLYQSGLSTYNAALQNALTARQEANRQAVIASGFDPLSAGNIPGSLQSYLGDVDQTTRDAAAANQFSTKAQLDQAYKRTLGGIPYDLAGRGAARSGAAVTHAGAANEAYQGQQNTALQNLLSALGGNVNTYGQSSQQALDSWNAAKLSVAQMLAQAAGYSGPDSTPAVPNYDQYGNDTNASGPNVLPNLGGQNVQIMHGNVNGGTSFYTPSYKPSPALQKVLTNVRKKGQDTSWVAAMNKIQAGLRR